MADRIDAFDAELSGQLFKQRIGLPGHQSGQLLTLELMAGARAGFATLIVTALLELQENSTDIDLEQLGSFYLAASLFHVVQHPLAQIFAVGHRVPLQFTPFNFNTHLYIRLLSKPRHLKYVLQYAIK
jgi:hypothetical protein